MKIRCLGSNGRYQLGLLHNEDVSDPQNIDIDDHGVVKHIANGGNHTLLLTNQGDLYGAGLNSSGQLGFISSANSEGEKLQIGFTQVNKNPTDPKFELVAGGWEYSVFVDKNGAVYTCGIGSKGELGLGEDVTDSVFHSQNIDCHSDSGSGHITTYCRIKSFPPPGIKVKDVKCGLNHTVVLMSDGSVWGWGASRNGQLGDNLDAKAWEPRLVFHSKSSDSPIVYISCGRQFTVLGSTTAVYVLGGDRFGVRTHIPKITEPIRYVGCGWSNIHVHLDSGRVLSWGNNSHGQLIPDSCTKFSKISVGSEHVLAIDESGHNVLAWGWGEHGNCGQDGLKSDNGISLVMSTKNKVHDVFAGQATGWILEKELLVNT